MSPVTPTNLTATRFGKGSTGKQHEVLPAHENRTSQAKDDKK